MFPSIEKKDNQISLAKESLKTKKAREKLVKRFERVDAKMTKESLEKKGVEIRRWISRNASQRVTVRAKTISLFDENQHTAPISERVAEVSKRIIT